jgi:DNA-binding transcriptional LysR family regulator
MKVSLDDMKLYVRVVELGSLRLAAQESKHEPSTVTRRIAHIEKQLSIKLLERSKVRSVPTEAGQQYYDKLRILLAEFDQLNASVSSTKDMPKGLLRVSCPVDFGAQHVSAWLYELQSQHEQLDVEMLLSDQFVNLVESGIDIAIRIGELEDSSLRARHLGTMSMVIVGSQAYLDNNPNIATPGDLNKQRFVLYNWLAAGNTLKVTKEGQTQSVTMRSRFVVNNVGAIANLVEAGAGLHFGPRWLFNKSLQEGTLVKVLPDWQKPRYPVHALYSPTKSGYLPAKIRASIDLLVQKMASMPL